LRFIPSLIASILSYQATSPAEKSKIRLHVQPQKADDLQWMNASVNDESPRPRAKSSEVNVDHTRYAEHLPNFLAVVK
jgi:hypothetical protein